jgi:hypothetical protein
MGEVVKEEVPILEVARGDIRPFCRYFLYLPRSNSRSCLIILTVTRSVVLCCVVLCCIWECGEDTYIPKKWRKSEARQLYVDSVHDLRKVQTTEWPFFLDRRKTELHNNQETPPQI